MMTALDCCCPLILVIVALYNPSRWRVIIAGANTNISAELIRAFLCLTQLALRVEGPHVMCQNIYSKIKSGNLN